MSGGSWSHFWFQDSEIFYDLTNFLKSSNQVARLAGIAAGGSRPDVQLKKQEIDESWPSYSVAKNEAEGNM